MRVLVKVGGTLLDDALKRRRISEQLADVAGQHDLVIVHGGGKQVTQFLEERGQSSRFVRGLRVSDEAVIDAVIKVIAGSVNKQLVSDLVASGRAAVGISGIDGLLTNAVQLDPELGNVGKPSASDSRLLDLLVSAGYLPVVACVAGDGRGHIFNVNADQMAVSCAMGWRADKLLFLTDVLGVQDRNGRLIPHLAANEAAELIVHGVARGGMQAKLEAATAALHAGLDEVIVAPGEQHNACQRLLSGEELGTRIRLEPVPWRGIAV